MPAPVPDIGEAPGSDSGARPGRRPDRRRRIAIIVGALVGLAAALALAGPVGIAVFHAIEGRPVPSFPSLAEHPDPALQGTVAYFDGPSRCVRIVAAAGRPSRDVLCLPPWHPDVEQVERLGKETGPQLVWRADGRLEVTMFLMPLGPYPEGRFPGFNPGWQKIVDVRTGAVEDVPAADVPSEPDVTTRPTVSPSGARISWTSNEMTGRVTVDVTDENGSRTLLSAHGPGEYTYRLTSAFWAPTWDWIAADDGRILVITPTDPALTRVLVDGGGGGTEFPTFAVTATNFLAARP